MLDPQCVAIAALDHRGFALAIVEADHARAAFIEIGLEIRRCLEGLVIEGECRALVRHEPDASGKVVIDFNQSYNPPCAFTAFATCPLPPPENRIDVAITAGEKAYEKPHEG
jgi:hypothetical protein